MTPFNPSVLTSQLGTGSELLATEAHPKHVVTAWRGGSTKHGACVSCDTLPRLSGGLSRPHLDHLCDPSFKLGATLLQLELTFSAIACQNAENWVSAPTKPRNRQLERRVPKNLVHESVQGENLTL